MIRLVIEYLNAVLKDLVYADRVFGLVERKEQDSDKVYPVAYIDGKETQVLNLSKHQSVIYHRLLETSRPVIADQQTRVKDQKWDYTYGLRLVAFVRHKNLGKDEFDATKLSESLAKAVSFISNRVLRTSLNASAVTVQVTNIETRIDPIVEAEATGFKVTSDWVAAMVDYELVITIRQSCVDACTDSEFVCPPIGGQVTIENSDQSYSEHTACGSTFILPDTDYEIYFDSVLQDSFSLPTLKEETITIVW
jgi:hypothetical protein